eukprot:scaffold34925_cov83-Phaeocystis_antarctica.AAC.1
METVPHLPGIFARKPNTRPPLQRAGLGDLAASAEAPLKSISLCSRPTGMLSTPRSSRRRTACPASTPKA